MTGSSSPNSLPTSFSSLSLSNYSNLQDEDLTIMSSSGFEGLDSPLPQPRFTPSAVPPPEVRERKEFTYGGSMGVTRSSPSISSEVDPVEIQRLPPPLASSASGNGKRKEEVDETVLGEGELERFKQLKAQRDGLIGMNEVLEQVLGNLRLVEGKMEAFGSTIETSHRLLDLYIRLSSQAEHTQELLLDPDWHGTTKEHQYRQEALERAAQKAREEEEAAELAAAELERERLRKESEERRAKEDAAAKLTRGVPPRGRGTTTGGVRGSSSTSSGIGRGGIPGRGTAPVTGVRGVRGLRSRVGVTSRGRGTGSGASL